MAWFFFLLPVIIVRDHVAWFVHEVLTVVVASMLQPGWVFRDLFFPRSTAEARYTSERRLR